MYYFIINPHSRSDRGMDAWKTAEKILKERQIRYEAHFTEYPGHASLLASGLASRSIPCVLGIVGGDGTLNEAINGLMKTDFSHITLGYLPTGSGNDFARGMGISREISSGVCSLLNPKEIAAADIGISKTPDSQRYFLVSSGMGYDAEICKCVTASPLKKLMNRLHLGKLSYVLLALKLLAAYRPCPVCLRLDKQKTYALSSFYFITGMNQKYEGGGVKFCPFASYDDKLLDFCIVGRLSKLKILALFPTAFFGKHGSFRGIHLLRGKRLDLISQTPLPVHCDGEDLGLASHLTLTVSDKQIKVIVS